MPTALPPRLIVNADDLGCATGRDDAIFELARQACVTSATLLVNGTTAATAAQRAAAITTAGGFRLGLHLNLSEGAALGGRSSLTDAAGQMPGKFALRQRLGLPPDTDGAITDADLRREMRAQIERFCALTGALPTHVDGHHHIQVVPRIAGLLAPILTREFGIRRIRLPSPEGSAGLDAAWAADPATLAFQQAIDRDAAAARPIYQNSGLRSPTHCIGRTLMGYRLQAAALRQALDRCRADAGSTPAVVELMCHPGHPSAADSAFGQSGERIAETGFLGSPDFAAATAGWQRIGWSGLTRPAAAAQKRILIYSKLQPGSGNATTAERLAAVLPAAHETLFRRLPEGVPDDPFVMQHEIADLRRMVDEEAIDLVVGIHLYRAGTVLRAALAGQAGSPPYLLLASGTDVDHNLQDSAQCAAISAALTSAAGLATLTDLQLRTLEATLPSRCLPEHRTVSPCNPDLPAASTYSLRRALGLGPDQPIVLLPAGIRPVKDVAFAIEAGAQALIDHPDHVLVIAGPTVDADYHAHCRSLIVEWQLRHRGLKGRILMLDALPRADYLAALKEAALLLNTSKSEGLSNALLEAMGAGIPVLARDIAGNRQIVREGETGLLFDGLARFVAQYRRRFADAGLVSRLLAGGRAEYARRCAPASDDAGLPTLVNKALSGGQSAPADVWPRGATIGLTQTKDTP